MRIGITGSAYWGVGPDDEEKLVQVLANCAALAHGAGINRETGQQNCQRIHIDCRCFANRAHHL